MEAPTGRSGRELPRVAGISSFGAGGANAHVVVEEYLEDSRTRAVVSSPLIASPCLIVLSARTEERLRAYAQALRAALDDYTDADLAAIACTLQLGREAMEHRLACSVSSLDELKSKLPQCNQRRLVRTRSVSRRGQARQAATSVLDDEDFQRTVEQWLAKHKYARLLQAWCEGVEIPWAQLHGDAAHRCIALPTYPFATDRYWIDAESRATPAASSVLSLHPLAQQNTSTLEQQRFTASFRGDESFLRDHIVQGQRMLPAVCYLEMARAAVALAAELDSQGQTSVQLRNVVWLAPVLADQPVTVHVALYPRDRQHIDFEIYSAADPTDRVIHAQGSACIEAIESQQTIDLAQLQATCTRRIDADRCYTAFAQAGLEFGTTHRSVVSLAAGVTPEGRRQVLAEIQLPDAALSLGVSCVLNPSALDSALQTSLGLELDAIAEPGRPTARRVAVRARASANPRPHPGERIRAAAGASGGRSRVRRDRHGPVR